MNSIRENKVYIHDRGKLFEVEIITVRGLFLERYVEAIHNFYTDKIKRSYRITVSELFSHFESITTFSTVKTLKKNVLNLIHDFTFELEDLYR